MNTTRTTSTHADDRWRHRPLPPLSATDRLALAAGLRLMLWGHERAARRQRDARQRPARDAADRAARAAFEQRVAAGPHW